jgi:hypothetical protein
MSLDSIYRRRRYYEPRADSPKWWSKRPLSLKSQTNREQAGGNAGHQHGSADKRERRQGEHFLCHDEPMKFVADGDPHVRKQPCAARTASPTPSLARWLTVRPRVIERRFRRNRRRFRGVPHQDGMADRMIGGGENRFVRVRQPLHAEQLRPQRSERHRERSREAGATNEPWSYDSLAAARDRRPGFTSVHSSPTGVQATPGERTAPKSGW